MMSVSILPATAEDLAHAVSDAEYKRLLSWPRSRELQGDLLASANRARQWYIDHGQPFVASVRKEIIQISKGEIRLADGPTFHAEDLTERFSNGHAHALIGIAVTAGKEVSEKVAKHWQEGRPDEGFFLDRFAAAVTEHLVHWSSAFLCREMERSHETLLQHHSPGCGHWNLSEQHNLMRLFSCTAQIGPIKLLPSSALDPQYSLLAVMGVTHHKFAGTEKSICTICELQLCDFRRAPYQKS
jgi:hypothetical protein